MYKYILFDLDGTITEPFEGISKCVIYALDSLGIKVSDPNSLTAFVGPPLFSQFKSFCGLDEERAAEAVKKFRERYETTGWKECTLAEGTEELLEKLKKSGRTVALATSKAEEFAKRILEYFGIAGYFDFIGGAEMNVKGRNGKADVIEYVLEALNVSDRSEAVIVGDTLYDAEGAKAAGIDFIGALWGYGSREELEERGAVSAAESMSEVFGLL